MTRRFPPRRCLPHEIQQTFEQARRDGYAGAVVVTISSGLSATYETVSMVARQMEDFPVVTVDTKSIGVAAGMVVMERCARSRPACRSSAWAACSRR